MSRGPAPDRDGRPGALDLLGLARSLLIYEARPWRRRRLENFYASLIGPGALAFDVGAHVGNRTRALVAIGCRCIAVEPQPLFARTLAWRFRDEPLITTLPIALDARVGSATLRVSRRHPTVSTLSAEWIDRIAVTPGFDRVQWDRSVDVTVTTLDGLIAEFGSPDFCKLDTEGHEATILDGLSQPIPLMAFEYLPAALDPALRCIDRLERLGRHRYNLAVGERNRFELERWVDAPTVVERLTAIAANGRTGDIYARFDRRLQDTSTSDRASATRSGISPARRPTEGPRPAARPCSSAPMPAAGKDSSPSASPAPMIPASTSPVPAVANR